jgi:uncharacterized membrane protein
MIHLLFTALIFIILDLLWFQFSLPRFYNPTFLAVQKENMSFRISGGIFAWLLLAFGINYFVLANSSSKTEAFINGALLGFVIYGVYNGTNYATLKNYNIETAIADLTWGTIATGSVSLIAFSLFK